MRLIMLGPPGAGKGTQAAKIAAGFGISSVTMGSAIMLNDRENILNALREKPLKVCEVMKRANLPKLVNPSY
jgi:adenylate kinase family enzyme